MIDCWPVGDENWKTDLLHKQSMAPKTNLGPFGATFSIVSHDLVPPSCGVGHMPTTIAYVELLALLEMRIDQVDQIWELVDTFVSFNKFALIAPNTDRKY